MTVDPRTNRSYRVVPGTDEDAVAEAFGSPADAVFVDLEDGVAPGDKELARERTVGVLDEHGADGSSYATVRVNGLDTEQGVADVRALATAPTPPDSLCLPKVRGASDIQLVADLLATMDSTVGLIAIVETATAVFDVHEIAHATPMLEGLIFGSVDFRRSAGMPTTLSKETDVDVGAQKFVPRVLISMAASTANVAAIDGGYYFVDDLAGLREDALAARSLGFDGKATGTAAHVEVINDAFGPTDRELATARQIVEAFEAADDDATLEIGGVLVERSHYEQQKALLERAGELDDE